MSENKNDLFLHQRDVEKFPKAIYDTSTKNTSFLRYARMLMDMGVKNYAFPLILLDPRIRGLDPHSRDLTFEQKILIREECCRNPWYLIREVARVRGEQYRANRGNIGLMWLFLNHIDTFLIQPRQTGKSVAVDWVMIWLIYFSPMRNTTIQLITKDASLRTDNVTRIKGFLDMMPSYLFVHSKADPDNTEELGYELHDIRYVGKVPRQSPTDAEKVGRGATSEVIQFDEPPYINHIKIIMQAALGATTAVRERAQRNGTPYGIMFTTTAGKIDSRDGGYVYGMLCSAVIWTEMLFDAGSQKELEEMLKGMSGSVAPLVNITLSHRQLGFTDEWLWETMTRNRSFGDAAERDYMNRWTNGTGSNPISPKVLERVNKSAREPDYVEICQDKYVINWYIPREQIAGYMASNPTIVGLDTSDAIGRDGIDMVIIDVKTLRPIATGTYNKTSIVKWISFFGNLMVKYKKMVWIPERKSSGMSIIDGVVEILMSAGENPFRRIFNTIIQDKERYEKDYYRTLHPIERERMVDEQKSVFGFMTTAKSRDNLYVQCLNILLDDASDKITDRKVISEMSGLITKNGRIDHAGGAHDDSVVAYLLAVWLLVYGRNIEDYGIDIRDVRCNVSNLEEDVRTAAEKLRDALALEKRERIDYLIESLPEAESEFKAMRIEQEINHLINTLGYEGSVNAETISELLSQVKDKRSGAIRRRIEQGSSYQSGGFSYM